MPRLVVNVLSTEPGEPPAMVKDSIDPEEDEIEDEVDLVQRIYRKQGSGVYSVMVNIADGSSRKLEVVWRGEIDVDGDRVIYIAEKNRLANFTEISTPKKPVAGGLKMCDRPPEDFLPDRYRETGSVRSGRSNFS